MKQLHAFHLSLFAVLLAWLAPVSEVKAIYGGDISGSWSWYHYPNQFIWNGFDVSNGAEFNDPSKRIKIYVDSGTPDGPYSIVFWHLVPYGSPKITFDVLNGEVINRVDQDFPTLTGGIWNIAIGGPNISQRYKDTVLSFWLYQPYVWTYRYGPREPGGLPVLTASDQTVSTAAKIQVIIDLRSKRCKMDADGNIICPDSNDTPFVVEQPGMAQASLNQAQPGIHVTDLPLTYKPAVGPAPSFRLTYSDLSPTLPPSEATPGVVTPPLSADTRMQSPFTTDDPDEMQKIVDNLISPSSPEDALATHLGSGWGLGLLSFVKGGAADRTYWDNPNYEAFYYEAGYGKERYSYINPPLDNQMPPESFLAERTVYPPQNRSRAELTYIQSRGAYERVLPDGSKQVFGKVVFNEDGHKYLFISKQIDAHGNTLSYNYYPSSSFARLTSLTDASGKVTQFFYADAGNPQRLTKITDPFNRSVTFAYDGNDRLSTITDPVGIVSEFDYNADGRITELTTPYGTSTFDRDFVAGWQMAQINLPDGSKERAELFDRVDSALTPTGGVPSGAGLIVTESNLNENVSFFWSRKAMAMSAAASQTPLSNGSYGYAAQTQWVQTGMRSINAPASVKTYGQNRIWYNYISGGGSPFQNAAGNEDAIFSPTAVAQLVENGAGTASQISKKTYNNLGNPTSLTDSLGRQTLFTYDTSGVDLLSVAQMVSGSPQTLASFTYNPLYPHKPVTMTDAAAQTTSIAYNSKGQTISLTNAKSETTTLAYTKDGYPEKITRPLSNITTLTWDRGMPRTVTNSEGFTIVSAYDNLDRLVRTTWPDGTSQVITYDKLDPKTFKDRENRLTTWNYNNIRQKTEEIDPLGRSTLFEWCRCGALQKLTDAAGNITQWAYDAGARLTSKTYDDGEQDLYTYQSQSGRLSTATDGEGRVKTYTYKLDGSLDTIAYTGDSNLTPDVSFTYGTSFPRVSTITDGTGVTTYAYKAVGSLGALGVYTETKAGASGFSSYTTTLAYDELGRVTSKSIDGNDRTATYDAMGRVSAWTNALGTFGATYVTGTGKPNVITYPNGQTTTYSYHDNNQKGEDLRLAGILNQTSGSSLLSSFAYQYNLSGGIKTWTQTAGANPAEEWKFGYDKADQLLSGTLALAASPYTISSQLSYQYDLAGNRSSQQNGAGVKNATYNELNQITAQDAGGWMKFKGQTNEAAYVRVKSNVDNTYVKAASESSNGFSAVVPVASGSNTITVEATDTSPNNNVSTKAYTVNVSSASSQTFTYDDVGNMLSDGSKSYTWDAENRLVKITYSDSTSTEFSYDGLSRRVKTLEKNSGGTVTSEKRFVWAGGNQPAEERNSSNTTIVRYFADGEQVPAATSPANKLFYTKDHLGSVRELTDDNEAVRARYGYDLWGNTTKISGDLDTVVGYTGHHFHGKSGLYLAMYRGYDPTIGRWLSRDLIAESGGINLYGYALNDPINNWDPLGLDVRINYVNGKTATVQRASEFVDAVRKSEKGSIDSIFVDGHATPESQTLGYGSGEDEVAITGGNVVKLLSVDQFTVNISMKDLLKDKLTPNARINLLGCNAGGGKENVAKYLSEQLPGTQVLASPYVTRYPVGIMDRNTVSFKTKIYVNGQEAKSVQY